MSQTKAVIAVSDQTTLQQILDSFLASDDDVVLLDVNSVISTPHLELLTDYPRSASASLVGKQLEYSDVLVRGGKIASAQSASHKATITNRVFAGALRLSQNQKEEIRGALEAAIGAKAAGHALELALVALVRATIRVDAVEILGAPFARSESSAERSRAEQELAKLKLPKLRLKMANRANDGFFSVFVLRRFSKLLTFVAVKIGATPNQVTIASFAIGLLAALLFARGDFWSLVSGALLLQLSIVVDCVDGELARYTRKFSELGAWLDAITDRVKEYAVFLGLAYGAMVHDGLNLWLPAIALMIIQTFRHLSDYNFAQVNKARTAEQPLIPIDYLGSWDGIEPKEDADSETDSIDPNDYLKRRIRYWLGKIIVFPIGERWLAISFTAAVGGALFTFTLMPLLALFSMIWVYRVRFLKSIELPKTRISSNVIVRQLDLGFGKKSLFKRLDWLEPSLLRALELGALLIVFALTQNLGVASFVILFSIAYHHYDNLYRAMQGESKPEWLTLLGYTVFGRILLLSLAAFLGWNLWIFASYFLVLFLVVSSLQWVISHKTK